MARLIIGELKGKQQMLIVNSITLILLKDNLKKFIPIHSEYVSNNLFNSLIDEETSKMLQLG